MFMLISTMAITEESTSSASIEISSFLFLSMYRPVPEKYCDMTYRDGSEYRITVF